MRAWSRHDDAGATTPTQPLGAPPDPAPPEPVTGPRPPVRLRAAWRRVGPPFKRAWPILRWVVGVAALAVTVDVLAGHRGELTGIGTVFDHLRWWWLVPALCAETASELCFVIVQQRLLNAGGLAPPLAPLTGVTVASQAMTSSMPGGAAVAAVYGFRWYRRFGADDAVAGWALVGTTVSAALSLALLATAGLVISTEEGATLDLVPAVLGVLVVTLAVGILFVYERPLVAATRFALRVSHRLIGRPRGDHEPWIERIVERAAVVRLSNGEAGALVGWASLNWLFDCTCFGLAFLAVGSGIPWKGLLLAYGAGQLAANLPITPGGLGAVEGSITIALSYFGGGTTADISAVLVYRVISFWLVLLVGWAAWGLLAWSIRRGRFVRNAREAPVAKRIEIIGRRTAIAHGASPATRVPVAVPAGTRTGTRARTAGTASVDGKESS